MGLFFEEKRLENKKVKDLFNYTQNYNCALISAELAKMSAEYNAESTRSLHDAVEAFGYDYVPTLGYWKYLGQKEFEQENSCFVVGSTKERDSDFLRSMKNLRKEFEQEAVLLSLLTPLGYTISYYLKHRNKYERAGVFTTSNIEEILEEALRLTGNAGYTELAGAKFVFTPEKVVRSWGAKDQYNVGRKNPKLLYTWGIGFSSSTVDKEVEALLEDYDRWVEELRNGIGIPN